MELIEKIQNIPTSSGVYLMKNSCNEVIYVGKAKNLKNRVRSYFTKTERDTKGLRLVSEIHDFDFIITDNEKEALILENNLIKKYRPKFNVNLRDDKNFLSIKIATNEAFPSLQIVRKIKKDGAIYFGPFPKASVLRNVLREIHKIFPLRKCRGKLPTNRSRPCLNFQIGRCLGPCCGLVSKNEYDELIDQVKLFFEGKNKKLKSILKKKMKEASDKWNFEQAARLRDRISYIEQITEKQKMVSTSFIDQDVIAIFHQGDITQIQLLFIRNGKLLGGDYFKFQNIDINEKEMLSSFIKQYYHKERFIPKEIILPLDPLDKALITQWLSEKKGSKVNIIIPKKGERFKLLNLAIQNARINLESSLNEEEKRKKSLEELKIKLKLNSLPKTIEAFDISNISGKMAVGSMVVFEDGSPEKNRYRHYNIKTVDEFNDYAMMYEVLKRRYTKAEVIPNLIMVDGGKGQLKMALEVLNELNIKGVDVIALAKAKGKEGIKSKERIFIPHRKNPVILKENSLALKLLTQIRDESHRVAISHYRKRKIKEDLSSVLKKVPGIGEIKSKRLMKSFKSIEDIKNALDDEIKKVQGIRSKDIENIRNFFKTIS
ncbi:MAG: excinuclease ABC subunit UvrC [Deltaproteobacteria bacterium]|nr:excinuclease ABC subunit UvrC [Deltaproteobacteria bacterium]